MENWLKRNLKYITILFLFLFLIKNTQNCNRGMSMRIMERNHLEIVDSLGGNIDSLNQEIRSRDYRIVEAEKEGSEKLAKALSQTSGESAGNIQSLLRQLERAKLDYEKQQQRIYDQEEVIKDKQNKINKLQQEVDSLKRK